MSVSKNYIPTQGYTEIVKPGDRGITQLHFGMLTLTPQTTFFDHSDNTEVALIALTGHCTLLVGHNGNKANGVLGERSDVFQGEACIAYIPHHTTYEIIVGEIGVEVAVCKVESHSESAAVILAAGETIQEDQTHLKIWENVWSDDVDGGPRNAHITPTEGEAICLHRAPDMESTTLFGITRTADPKKTARVQLYNNDVLMLSEHESLVSVKAVGMGYQLWTKPNL